MSRALVIMMVVALWSAVAARGQEPFDIVIRGGSVFDGHSAEPRTIDLAIRGDRLALIGAVPAEAKAHRTIDATGLIVCPGFIDLHTHSDDPILEEGLRENRSYLTQGCTTIVTGNCGAGHVDAGAFLARVEKLGAGTNVAHLLPHGALRERAMGGSFARPPTEVERDAMRRLVEEGMAAGAFGLTTGLIYTPGSFATTDEIADLCAIVARGGGIYASHIRGEGDHLFEALDEALAIGKRSGCPVHVSHLKAAGPANHGKAAEALRKLAAARQNGMKVTADQYPYAASSTSLGAMLLPPEAREGSAADLVKRLEDPATAAGLREAIIKGLEERGGAAKLQIARFSPDERLNGLTLEDAARSGKVEVADLVIDLLKRGGAQMVSFTMSEADVERIMGEEWVATASDGSSKLPDSSRPHPRCYGTFPRKVGRYALERGVVSLGHAIRSCTGLPADILGLADRGRLTPGACADVLVFDPKAFRDHATYADPHRFSTGVVWLFVNGQAAIAESKPTGALAGRALKRR